MIRRRIYSWSAVPRAAWALAAGLIAAAPFVEAAKPLSEVPLVLSFGAAPTGIHSDGLSAPAPYSTADYADGLQNVRAFLFPSGNLSFTTRANAAAAALREVCFGPGNALPAFPAVGCWPLENQVMTGVVGDSAEVVNIQTLMASQSVRRLVRVNWKVGTDTYRLGYGTDMDGNDMPDSPPVVVTCTAATAAKCTTWTVAPETDGTAALFVAHQVAGKGGKLTTGPNEYVGHYVMPFVQTLAVK